MDVSSLQRIGPYQVVRYIDEGAFAWVFEVVDPKFERRRLALKMLKPEAAVGEEFQRQLAIRAGETTSDKEFTLETVNCLGACALGPVVVVDGHYFSNAQPDQIEIGIERLGEVLTDILEEESNLEPMLV